jgi:CheY-like chemotaxis protein
MLKRPRCSVLVVDDDPSVLRWMHLILSEAGYDVLQAADGLEAVVRYREHPADVLITDLVMPDQEGLQTMAALRRDYPRLKTIAISGAAGGKYLKLAERLGAHAVLQKPFNKSVLLDTVRKVLESPFHTPRAFSEEA